MSSLILNRSCPREAPIKKVIGDLELDEETLDWWRGKFRRMCEPKRISGHIQIPNDIFEQYQTKGKTREKSFECFIKTGGDKEGYVKG